MFIIFSIEETFDGRKVLFVYLLIFHAFEIDKIDWKIHCVLLLFNVRCEVIGFKLKGLDLWC